MRIESIDIRGFGCLVNRRYEFPEDRASLVIADNEKGKSTLAAAILAALCGFPKRRQPGEVIKLSEVYRPWNGDTYAIEMDIIADGQQLRIERDFAKDTFVVRDRETGKDISASYDRDLARQIFILPREDFQRIAFISGKDVPSLGSASGIQARLSALVEGSTEDTGAEIAIAALDGARYTVDTPLTIVNAIKRLTDRIDEKRRVLNALDASMEEVGEENRRLDESKALHAELFAELASLDSQHRAARLAEEQANARQVEELRVELAIGQAETRLGVIKQARQSAKQFGASIMIGGIGVAVVSFCLWLLGLVGAMPTMAGAVIGIGIAAAGAVWAAKADVADADEKARLERQIEEARHSSSDEPREAIFSSAMIEDEQRDLRKELDSLNATIIDLEKRVGATVDAYRRDYDKLTNELRDLERERSKAERFGSAIEIAKGVMREVSEGSRKHWAAALNRSASSILPHLNPDYDDLRFDDELNFTIRHIPSNKILEKAEIDARLSTGAKDQVYLAVRLACCEELSRNGESIPVLLDDPLMAADDSRFSSGLRYLVESFVKDHQVIILSCSRQRHEAVVGEEWFADCAQFTV